MGFFHYGRILFRVWFFSFIHFNSRLSCPVSSNHYYYLFVCCRQQQQRHKRPIFIFSLLNQNPECRIKKKRKILSIASPAVVVVVDKFRLD